MTDSRNSSPPPPRPLSPQARWIGVAVLGFGLVALTAVVILVVAQIRAPRGTGPAAEVQVLSGTVETVEEATENETTSRP